MPSLGVPAILGRHDSVAQYTGAETVDWEIREKIKGMKAILQYRR